jgi:hypothetical protein
MHRLSRLASLFTLTLLAAPSAMAAGDPPQPHHVIDRHVPAPGTIQQLTLKDGSRLYGHVESMDGGALVFRTIGGGALTVADDDILDLRLAPGRVVNNQFRPRDPHDTRLFFAPTARSLPRGEGYAGFYEVVLPFVQVGLTDRISIGGGTPLIFAGDFHPVWFTPKVQLIARERTQVAAGIIHLTAMGPDTPDGGIAYAVATVGPADASATIGLGYAYSGRDRTPTIMIGGETRTGRRFKLMTENWIWSSDGARGFASGGVRFLGDRLSADLAIMVPLVDSTIPFPFVSFAWGF